MDLFNNKTWYWGIDCLDSVKLVTLGLNTNFEGTSFEGLNEYRKSALKDYHDTLIIIYRSCNFKTKVLKENTNIMGYRLYGGTEVFDVEDRLQKKVLDVTKKLSILEFDKEITREQIVYTCNLAIKKIVGA